MAFLKPNETVDLSFSRIINNLTTYFEVTNKFFSSFSQLQLCQKQFLDLINGRFQLFDIIIRDVLLNNRKRKKKYYDLYQEETCNLLQKTSNLFALLNENSIIYENLENLSNELLFEIETFEKSHKTQIIAPLSKRSTVKGKITEEDGGEIISSRRDLISSNRILFSAKTKAFNSVLKKDETIFLNKKQQYFNENSNINFMKKNGEVYEKNIEKQTNATDKDQTNMFEPKQEKKIILELMKKEYANHNHEWSSLICHQGKKT